MPAIINPMITDAGLAAAVDADANEIQIAITHISLGTGKYDAQAAGAGMTALAGLKETVAIGGGQVSGTGGVKMTCRFNSWGGTPYDASELGFWAGDPASGGILFAVHSHPSDVLVNRNALDYVATFVLQLTRVPAGSITIVIEPDEAAALALIADHEGKADPHPRYLKRDGDIATGALRGVTPPQHDDSKLWPTTDWVQRVGVNFPSNGGMAISVTPASIGVADIGRWVDIKVNNAALTIPKASTVRVGATIQICCSVASATLLPTDDDKFVYPGGEASAYPITFGENVTLARNAVKEWRVVNVGFRMPAGMVAYFAGNVAPAGWLKLNGVTLSRAAYPALWAYAQSTGGIVTETEWWNNNMSGRFSSGVAGSDFRIPDLRGVFLRSLDEGRGIDVGRAFGTYQEHANRTHAHGLNDPGHVHTLNDPGHAHGVYDPGHIHSAWTDAQGGHAHGVPPGVDAGFLFGGNAGIGNNNTAQGIPPGGAGFGNKMSQVAQTGAVGNHAHNVGIGLNGTGIGIYGAGTGISMGSKTTGMSVQSEGSEARPRNVAFSLFIKY